MLTPIPKGASSVWRGFADTTAHGGVGIRDSSGGRSPTFVTLPPLRRGPILQLLLWALPYAGIALAIALAIPWLPTAATREAGRIHFVYWFTTGISIAVFAVVAAVLTYELIHFRAAPDDESDGAPIHGHTLLEIVWTAIPAVLVTAISIVS